MSPAGSEDLWLISQLPSQLGHEVVDGVFVLLYLSSNNCNNSRAKFTWKEKPLDSTQTGCKDIFLFFSNPRVPSHLSFNTRRGLLAHIKSSNKHFFVCDLSGATYPAVRWQVLDIKRAELPRGSLCGFRWWIQSLLNLRCNEWVGRVGAGERHRTSGACWCVW